MYAVIRSGGRQYKVAEGDVIFVDRLPVEAGQDVILDQVLMVGEEGGGSIGAPLVAGAAVTAKVLEQARARKIIVFKKKRRKNYRRKRGHRQDLTVLRITGIAGEGGKKLTSAAKAKAPAKAKAKKPAGQKAPAKKAAPKKASAGKKSTGKPKTKPKATPKAKT